MERQDLKHLFWDCPKTQEIITFLKKYFDFDFPSLISGTGMLMYDYILLLAKFYIYKSKCLVETPTIHGLKQYVASIEKADRFTARIGNYLDKHEKKWKTIQGVYCNR